MGELWSKYSNYSTAKEKNLQKPLQMWFLEILAWIPGLPYLKKRTSEFDDIYLILMHLTF